jgi:uncharacterized repeat protein (TIGR03803 family)
MTTVRHDWASGSRLCVAVLSVLSGLSVFSTPAIQAQTFSVIYSFTGGQDGASPYAGLTLDSTGNLYGTTHYGGAGYGGVFELKRMGSGWQFNGLYTFAGGNDGAMPYDRVVFGPNGSLYGTTQLGGGSGCPSGTGCGTVFNLRPCPTIGCHWTETAIYRFTGGNDGLYPIYGNIIFDHSGNIYSTAYASENLSGCGLVYKLTPLGVRWHQSVLYGFNNDCDPSGGVIFDSRGNLYGTTAAIEGGVYELMQPNWTHSIIGAAGGASAGLIFDSVGNLYGATQSGGPHGGGTVFELVQSGGGWTYELLYGLTGTGAGGPCCRLTMDAAGSLYGTTEADGVNGWGSVFKLTHSAGGWSYTSLHDFSACGSDGCLPYGDVILDGAGNIYGTTATGGAFDHGVVFEIKPN